MPALGFLVEFFEFFDFTWQLWRAFWWLILPTVLIYVFQGVFLWWIIVPLVLFYILKNTWLWYIRTLYIIGLNWILLEIKIPKDVFKTPKAMEQVMSGLHGIQSNKTWWETWWDGEVQEWFSFEMVGQGGDVYFYVYTAAKYRNLVEANFYGQYPTADIAEVQDYMRDLPPRLPNEKYDISALEFVLTKEDAYPIRSYQEFEELKEEKRLDPLASLMEFLGNLSEGEIIAVQILARPVNDKWKKDGERLINKLIGRQEKIEWGFLDYLLYPISALTDNIIEAIYEAPEKPKKPEDKKEPTLVRYMSEAEKKRIEMIEKNISKLGFETSARWIYIAPRERFTKTTYHALNGVFKQFNSLDLNGFRPNKDAGTKVGGFFWKETRTLIRKKRLYYNFLLRGRPRQTFILNTEELATIYHFPGLAAAAPAVPRIQATKGGAPPGLPVE